MKKLGIFLVVLTFAFSLSSCGESLTAQKFSIGIVGTSAKNGFQNFENDINGTSKNKDITLSQDYTFQNFADNNSILTDLTEQKLDFAVVSPYTAAFVWNKTNHAYKVGLLIKLKDSQTKIIDNKNYQVVIIKEELTKGDQGRYVDFMQHFLDSRNKDGVEAKLPALIDKQLLTFYQKGFPANKVQIGDILPDSNLFV